MKKNKLGITEGEVVADRKSGYIFADAKRHICTVSHFNYDSIANMNLIADAFNTANKCGLLPSELLEQNTLLLEALIQIRTVGGLYLDGKLSKIIRDTINQIEQ